MNSRLTYVIGSPLLSGMGAATTVIAPMLLDPVNFTQFVLLNSVFSYLAEFDLGLARLTDRMLPGEADEIAQRTAGSLLFTRYCIAAVLLSLCIVCISDLLTLCAAAGGIAMLLANGPLSFHRARSNMTRLTFASFLLQFGMTLPRLTGLVLHGVPGAILGLSLWTGLSSIVLNLPMLRMVRFRLGQLHLIKAAIPLFLFNALWLLYLFANRWIAWWITASPADAGLFAFGANLSFAMIGVLMVLSQPFYPRYLAAQDPTALAREIKLLLLLGAAGEVAAMLSCRFALPIVFPRFGAAASTTAALMVCTLPLGLAAWLLPLAIARSTRVWDAAVFPVGVLLMFGLMALLNRPMGITGQAWACLPSAMLVLAVQLTLVVKSGLLHTSSAVHIWSTCLLIVGLAVMMWCLTF